MERKMFFDAYPEIFRRAFWLRNNMTPAERKLWEELRNNKMGIRFKAQHPMSCYIVDFYSYALKLVIEVDGPIHDFNVVYDQERTKNLEQAGNLVIRFSNEDIMNNMSQVLELIRAKMTEINEKKSESSKQGLPRP